MEWMKPPQPGGCHEEPTDCPIHNKRVAQGLGNGNIAVICHDGKQEDLDASDEVEEEELGQAAAEGNDGVG